jgi:hypothetical protein
MDEPRRILLIEVDADLPLWTPTPLEVPLARRLRLLEGTLEEVRSALAELTWPEPLPPMLYIHLQVPEFTPQAPSDLFKLLADTFPDDDPAARPKLVRIRQFLPAGTEAEAPAMPAMPALRDLEPEDVFRRLCDQSGVELDDDLLAAFRSLVAEVSVEHGAVS